MDCCNMMRRATKGDFVYDAGGIWMLDSPRAAGALVEAFSHCPWCGQRFGGEVVSWAADGANGVFAAINRT